MPRPNKTGLDYFPLDVHLDEKVELIEAKHGLLGFGLIIKLFQDIYKNGYYLDSSEERLLLLKKKVGVDYDFIVDVINDGCKWNLFNEKLFNKYSILTSCGIQKRFIEATKRRKEVEFIGEYLLVSDIKDRYKDEVIVNINFINANNNGEKDDSSTQSKEKKRKETIYSRVIDYLNRKTGSRFKPNTKTTKQFIDARVKENFQPDDFRAVIDFKCQQWIGDPKMQQYLKPDTLFGTKFEGYLEAARRAQKPLNNTHRKTPEQIQAEMKEALS